MGASKLNIYSNEITDMAKLAKVFSHPARIAILQFISKQNSCICNDIVDEVGIAQATKSQHLKVINDCGLLKGTFEGKSVCYCLNIERIQEIQGYFNSFFDQTKSNCC